MGDSIKLLTVIETLGKGGAERVLVNTLPELQKLGIVCEVAILFKEDDLADELKSLGVKVHKLDLSHKWNIFEARKKIIILQKHYAYDIVHAHLFFAHFHTALSFLFNKKIKKVVTFHNLGFNEYPANTILKKIRKKIEEFCVKQFDKKTAVSSDVKEHYALHLNIKNIDVIYNSFPIKNIEKFKVNLKETNDIFHVLTPGRLVPKKGHKYLIEAIYLLNKRGLEIDFLIVGSGPLEKSIKESIQNIKNITHIHAIPHSDLMQLYNKMDLIVIPSVHEAFGLVVGEAMIMGKAIVATKVDGIIEMIENEKEGLLVAPRNAKALAEAIERLYSDKTLRQSLANNAQEKIRQFDTTIIAKQWKTYYEEMLNG